MFLCVPNPRPLTYTRRHNVKLSPAQREAFREYALEHETAVSIILREAALVEIGRADLSLARETEFPVGGMLDRVDRPRARRSNRVLGSASLVYLTDQQHRALSAAAVKQGVSLATLLRDAGLRKVGAPSAEARIGMRGRPVGSRNASSDA